MRLIRVIRTSNINWMSDPMKHLLEKIGIPQFVTLWNSKNYYLFTNASYFFLSWGRRTQYTPFFSIFKIHFNIIFPPTNAFIFCSSLNLGDQYLHKYKEGGKSVFPYVVIFGIWLSLRKTKDSVLNWANSSKISSALNFLVQETDLYVLFDTLWNLPYFQSIYFTSWLQFCPSCAKKNIKTKPKNTLEKVSSATSNASASKEHCLPVVLYKSSASVLLPWKLSLRQKK